MIYQLCRRPIGVKFGESFDVTVGDSEAF